MIQDFEPFGEFFVYFGRFSLQYRHFGRTLPKSQLIGMGLIYLF